MSINLEALHRDISTFKGRQWQSERNKNLLRMVADLRLNLAPCTVWTLDKHGFNHLEILSFSHMVGKVIHKLTPCECDQLNYWEETKGIVFGYEQKETGKYLKAKADHFCYAFTASGRPQGVSALFDINRLYKVK